MRHSAERNPIDYYRLYPRPTYLLMYKEPQSSYHRSMSFRTAQPRGGNALSRNAAMKMRRAISWLVASAEWKKVYEKRHKALVDWRINFITLTIPQQNDIDDRKVKRVLNAWLKYAAYQHGLKNYVWKAEPQERGDLHFHIITDCYIHYTTLQLSWNRLLKRHNLNGTHENPNSTDIHAVIEKDVSNLTAYAVDYMQKKEKTEDGEQRRTIKGRLWGSARALSKAGKKYIYMDHTEAENLHAGFMECNWKCKQVGDTASYIYMVNGFKPMYSFIEKSDPIHDMYRSELAAIKSESVQLALFERAAAMSTS